MTLLQPLLTAYANASYDSMETAIFPSYFHGKCQRFSKDGQDPPGCPDPDCPVVCGTPGSLVHFYPTLRYIAWNNTKSLIDEMLAPGQPTFDAIEKMVEDAQTQTQPQQDEEVEEPEAEGLGTEGLGTADLLGILKRAHTTSSLDSSTEGPLGRLSPVSKRSHDSEIKVSSSATVETTGRHLSHLNAHHLKSASKHSDHYRRSHSRVSSELAVDASASLTTGHEHHHAGPSYKRDHAHSKLSVDSSLSVSSSSSSRYPSHLNAHRLKSASEHSKHYRRRHSSTGLVVSSSVSVSSSGRDHSNHDVNRVKPTSEDNDVHRRSSSSSTSSTSISDELVKIFAQFSAILEKACGGTASESTSGLPDCSWETAMKAYILSFN